MRSLKWKLYKIRQGIKNIVYFWRVIWTFKPWDYAYQLRLWQASLIPLRDCLENGNEVDVTRLKKVAKIQRCIDLIDRILHDDYFTLAEQDLGESLEIIDERIKRNADKLQRIFKLSAELERKDWNELFNTLRGQSGAELDKLLTNMKGRFEDEDTYEKWFDGSGMKSWWD